MTSIKKSSDISSDWTGSAYCVFKINWDYENGIVELSMPGYIKAALQKYQHPAPTRAEHAPHK
jgi:endonuclease I